MQAISYSHGLPHYLNANHKKPVICTKPVEYPARSDRQEGSRVIYKVETFNGMWRGLSTQLAPFWRENNLS
jgi:hypothetical protein